MQQTEQGGESRAAELAGKGLGMALWEAAGPTLCFAFFKGEGDVRKYYSMVSGVSLWI